jgi:hypothetical protein
MPSHIVDILHIYPKSLPILFKKTLAHTPIMLNATNVRPISKIVSNLILYPGYDCMVKKPTQATVPLRRIFSFSLLKIILLTKVTYYRHQLFYRNYYITYNFILLVHPSVEVVHQLVSAAIGTQVFVSYILCSITFAGYFNLEELRRTFGSLRCYIIQNAFKSYYM